MRAWVCIVAGRGGSGRCCHGFVEYAVTKNAVAAAKRGDIRQACRLSVAGKGDVGQAFLLSIAEMEDVVQAFRLSML